jgi:hypothetical protein
MFSLSGEKTIWDSADEWSVLTGIKVWGAQECTRGESPAFPDTELNADMLSEWGEEVNQDDFLEGRIRPTGVVVLFVSKKNKGTLWELSPECSAIWLSRGEAPGALASLRLQ